MEKKQKKQGLKKNAILGKSLQNFNYSSLPKVRRDETFFFGKKLQKKEKK